MNRLRDTRRPERQLLVLLAILGLVSCAEHPTEAPEEEQPTVWVWDGTSLATTICKYDATGQEDCEPATDCKVYTAYAMPNSWSSYKAIGKHYNGPIVYKITASTSKDTYLYGRVKYVGPNVSWVEHQFIDEITIQTGNAVGTVYVSFKGIPYGADVIGSICW